MTEAEQQNPDHQQSPPDDERRQQKEEDLYYQKELAFYSQAVGAFFSTALELDKSFLTISVAAIGFWVALVGALKTALFISTFGVVFFCLSLLAFAVTCGLVLTIFHFNKEAVAEFVNAPPGTTDPGPNSQKIKKLDVWVRWSFGIGVSSLMLFGMFTADRLLDQRNHTMTTSNDSNRNSGSQSSLNESFNKMAELRPGRDAIKSFTGGEQLRPQQPSSSGQGVAQVPASSGTSGSTNQNSTPANTGKK